LKAARKTRGGGLDAAANLGDDRRMTASIAAAGDDLT
jgi:hypothetical protein